MPEVGELREIRVHTDPSGEVRTETYMGREYLVAPMIMIQEGVLQGANSDVPEYCPASVIQDMADQWNGRPVVLNHPQVNGIYVSANSPIVLQDWAFGFVFNTTFDTETAQLKAEAWLDIERAAELGGDFQDAIDRINNKEVVEISTGLFAGVLVTKGKFNSRSYGAVWSHITSDHLAILSAGMIGACSVEDGCGIPRIQQAAEGPWGARPQEMRINTAALRTIQLNSSDEHCCASCKEAAMPKANTTVVEEAEPVTGGVELVEPTQEELTVLEARSALLVHAIPDTLTHNDVNKIVRAALAKKLGKANIWIAAITNNFVVYEAYENGYCCGSGEYKYWQLDYTVSDDHTVTFTGDPQEVVLTTKITPVVNEAGGVQPASGSLAVNGEVTMSTNGGPAGDQTVTTAVPVTGEPEAPKVNSAAAAAPVSVDAWLDSAPPEVAAMLRGQMKANSDRKAKLVETIKANEKNVLSDDVLNSMDNNTLEGIAALSVNTVTAPALAAQQALNDGLDNMRTNYGGRGGLLPTGDVTTGEPKVQEGRNEFGGAPAPKVFSKPEDFGTRVGVHKSRTH
ncbi:hypothetical protein MAINES_00510 [Brevundimonas phage vB_BpoS-MaInes]|nr:hypothetical protein MAINES_00510 [Brevundimonas phage vB_BpoS-MaInes]